MTKAFYKTIASLLILFSSIAQAQITPANNKISVDVSTYHVQNPAYNYDSSFLIGKNIGMSEVKIFINWTALETAPHTFDFTILDIANLYYPAYSMPIDINLNPINTNQLAVPSDLVSVAFNNPVFINRYKILLDSMKVHIPAVTISSLVIGSEIGAYLGNDSAKWSQYTIFYDSVSTYAKTLWPDLKVSVELQFSDFTNYNSYAQKINISSDYIGVSYYPLWGNFTVKPPYVVGADMDTLVRLYPTKPICYYQFGYPTSPTCGSSDSLQSEFILKAFQYWDYYAAHIRMIDFTWLTDLDTAAVNYYGTYYGLTDTIFLEYLRTIGLRQWTGNGIDKPALNELRCQAKQRGYNTLPLVCNTTGINGTFISDQNIKVYPNPASESIVIESPLLEANDRVLIFNSLGMPVKEIPMTQMSLQINISDLPAGLYFIGTKSNQNSGQKFVKL